MNDRAPRRKGRAISRPDHFALPLAHRTLTFVTQAGVFSHGKADAGTLVLLNAVLPALSPGMKVLDLGAGSGVLGLAIAASLEAGMVWMVDVDIRAIRVAEANRERNGIENARVILSDVTGDLPRDLRFDLVVSNPPTHSGGDVLDGFVHGAHQVLVSGGYLYMVVNRMLSIKRMMEDTFGHVEQVARRGGFMVLRARKADR